MQCSRSMYLCCSLVNKVHMLWTGFLQLACYMHILDLYAFKQTLLLLITCRRCPQQTCPTPPHPCSVFLESSIICSSHISNVLFDMLEVVSNSLQFHLAPHKLITLSYTMPQQTGVFGLLVTNGKVVISFHQQQNEHACFALCT